METLQIVGLLAITAGMAVIVGIVLSALIRKQQKSNPTGKVKQSKKLPPVKKIISPKTRRNSKKPAEQPKTVGSGRKRQ